MHPKTVTYQAIPYKIHILKFIAPGVSIKNIDWSKRVHKEYNYIYTGDNIDVQNLRLYYRTAYYRRSVRSDNKTISELGLFGYIDQTFTTIFGKEDYPEPLKQLRQYPSEIKGKNTFTTSSSNKSQAFYDYLTNPNADMIRIELEILGDPAYICQDMYTPIHEDFVTTANGPHKDASFSGKFESFNSDSFQPLIAVNYRIPDDISDKDGLMYSDGAKYRDENLFFNGLYQVNKIESKFNQGQFSQILHCSRFNNQQGEGAPVDAVNSATKTLRKAKTQDDESLAAIRSANFTLSKETTKLSNIKKKVDQYSQSGYYEIQAAKERVKKASKTLEKLK